MKALLSAKEVSLQPRLKSFSLDVMQGEAVGLLGVNGAGKSTALSLLAGGQSAAGGEIFLHGDKAGNSNRHSVGWLPQQSVAYPDMTVQENLRFSARLHGLNKSTAQHAVKEVSEQFGLDGLQPRLSSQLSGGQRRRLDLACTLIHSPEILLLDEPTAGLDLLQAEKLRKQIRQLIQGRAIVIASHILPDIEQLCDRVILMHAGRCMENATIRSDLRDMQAEFTHPPSDSELLGIPGIKKIISRNNGKFILRLDRNAPSIMPEKLSGHGWGLQGWQPAANNILQHFRELSSGDAQ